MADLADKTRDTLRGVVEWLWQEPPTRGSPVWAFLVIACILLGLSLLSIFLLGSGSATLITGIPGISFLLGWLGMTTYRHHRTLSALLRLTAILLAFFWAVLAVVLYW
jgi:hypothetical protein